ncbi:MAG: transposase, partial [Candidatus Margulisbacteria bacterium]|nr:transposase [Candidatus Margulisiibacteriota bacterium]
MKRINVWTNNSEAVEASILSGKANEPVLTEYGANEFAVDFLLQSGLWDHLLVKPKGHKANGKDWRQLGGIAILHELLHVGHLAKADKVIKDAKLMKELGFTLTEIESAKEQTKGVIHRDTIRNYFKAIPNEQSLKEFYGFVNFMREKKWVRGRTYVADGLEIEVYGKTYEGMGKVWSDKEKRWKYGYKAVLLMNVEEGRERIMGLAIGPISSDERKLLLQIFKDLEKYVDKIKNIMDVIVLDRGYWGYDFLEKTLVGQYQIDYVVIAKKSFMFVKEDLRHLIDSKQLKFQERQLYNRTKKERESVKVAFVK